jgi:hypothetical protein
VALLTCIWENHGRPLRSETKFPQLLSPLIRSIRDFLAVSKEPDYGISEETKGLLVTVGGAQIDRLLAPARKAREIRGISTTRAAGASLRSPVPVQTHFDRKAVKPGEESL